MKIETPKGMSIYNAVAYAKVEAAKTGLGEVSIEFNEIELGVHKDSLDLDICTIYYLKCKLRESNRGY